MRKQDAAGSHVKQKVSQLVLCRTATIITAKSMHEDLVKTFSRSAASSVTARSNATRLKHRVFFMFPLQVKVLLQETHLAENSKRTKESQSGTLKFLAQQEKLPVRHQSCYCVCCIVEEDNCTNKAWLDEWKDVSVSRDYTVAATRQATEAPILDCNTDSKLCCQGEHCCHCCC